MLLYSKEIRHVIWRDSVTTVMNEHKQIINTLRSFFEILFVSPKCMLLYSKEIRHVIWRDSVGVGVLTSSRSKIRVWGLFF